jgi:thiol-disulfide isomerase/thioredoxin
MDIDIEGNMMQVPTDDSQNQAIADTERPSPVLLIFLILPLAGLLVALIMVATDGQSQQAIPSTFVSAPPKQLDNVQAPDFEIPMLDGMTLVSPSDFIGRPLFINFWATWCGPCVRELPALEEFVAIHAKDDQGPALLTINMGETPEEIKGFLEELGIEDLPVALDVNQVIKADYGVQNLPTTFVIDKSGKIHALKLGEMRFEEMGLYLQQLEILEDE